VEWYVLVHVVDPCNSACDSSSATRSFGRAYGISTMVLDVPIIEASLILKISCHKIPRSCSVERALGKPPGPVSVL